MRSARMPSGSSSARWARRSITYRPVGNVYLPDCSYREMTEWALPVERLVEFEQINKRKQQDQDWHSARPFIRGGTWRNFRVKYPEANEMYTRMLQISQRLQQITSEEEAVERPHFVTQARTELYRGQCNCPYWHGAFGGLYLPHLRHAIYNHLIAADTLLESACGRPTRWVQIDADDFNLDARKEIRLAGDRVVAFLAPSRGGHLYELDVRGAKVNLLGTLNRRPEAYHEVVRHAAGNHHDQGSVASIHDAVRFKQPDLDKKLVYDKWPRKSLVDHFLAPGLDPAAFRNGDGEIGDFRAGRLRIEAPPLLGTSRGGPRPRRRGGSPSLADWKSRLHSNRRQADGCKSATTCRTFRRASGSISPSSSISPAWPLGRRTATTTMAAAANSASSNRSSPSVRWTASG